MENLSQNLEQLPAKFAELARDAAIKEAEYKSLDENKKAFLARIELEYRGLTIAETQRAALATEEWSTYLKGLNIARTDYLKSRAELNGCQVQFEILRSLNSASVAKTRLL